MEDNIVFKYFKELNGTQKEQILKMAPLYEEWNSRINVISRKDIGNLYEHHVLHCLSIAKIADFEQGMRILDLGTGGGFPGIPLAILYPEAKFTLCDSVGKKALVASEVAKGLGLKNVTVENCRAESLKGKFNYVVTRSVATFDEMLPWIRGKWENGIIALKGGNVFSEITPCISKYGLQDCDIEVFNISDWFDEDYFFEKKMVFIGR
jgi:16S rRNA (guanine527-N7)-methyltransferase